MFDRSALERIVTILRFALIWIFGALTLTSTQGQGLSGENILVPEPKGFEVGHQAGNSVESLVEYVPKGETVEDWSQMVTVQVFRDIDNADPERFGQTVASLWSKSCQGARTGQVSSAMENGYATSVWIYHCPLLASTGKPENMMAKFIAGADALYGVQYARRSALNEAEMRQTTIYLTRVVVCDTRGNEHPCSGAK